MPGPFTFDVTFNEPVDPASVQTTDLQAYGVSMEYVSAVTVLPGNTTVRFTISAARMEGVLSATIYGAAITDAFGNPGVTFSATYPVDFGTVPLATAMTTNGSYMPNFAAESPLGSLIYDVTATALGSISPYGDTDSFTLPVDPGQTITVVVTPTGGGPPTLRPTVELRDPGNRLALGILGRNNVTGVFAWLELRLCRLNLDIQFLFDRGHLQVLIRLIQLIVTHKDRAYVNVRLAIAGDRDLDIDARSLGGHNLMRLDAVAFGSNKNVRVWHAGHQQELGGIADAVRFLVGNDFDLSRFAAIPIAALSFDPEPGSAAYLAVLRCFGGHANTEIAGSRDLEANTGQPVAVVWDTRH